MLKLISYEVSQARRGCYFGDRGMVWSYGAWAGCKASLVASFQNCRDTVIVVRRLVLLKLPQLYQIHVHYRYRMYLVVACTIYWERLAEATYFSFATPRMYKVSDATLSFFLWLQNMLLLTHEKEMIWISAIEWHGMCDLGISQLAIRS